MKKLTLVTLATFIIMGLTFGAVPAEVKASEQGKNNVYQDLDERVKTMLISAAATGTVYGHHNIIHAELNGGDIEGNLIENSETLTVSTNTLENNFDHEIQLPTSGYEHEFTEETTTTNTTGWTFGYNGNAGFNIGMVSGGHSFSVDYNMSTANSVTNKETRTFSVPSVLIPVPAGKKYLVEYRFEKQTVSGRNRINADLFGDAIYYHNNLPLSPQLLYSALRFATDTQGFTQVIRDSGVGNDRFGIRSTGVGQFRTEFGTSLYIRTTDITNSQKPVLIETKTLPVKIETISEDTKVVE
ncbi:ETX/MTX2 family pore-forming toxin [Bacillus sp. FJAT-53060]|uniref:ETX/MTX2 family pore-forming toxin n=1 Tax=Bacillus TaxID=1386 RepID=UPI001CF955AA|nr:ETX/MTX2 family pore-forming toxin [Bacillus stratosphericus]